MYIKGHGIAGIDTERLGAYVEAWAQSAPGADDVDRATRDAQDALIEAGMVQYRPDGWSFKLHEKHPDAPKARLKLMIREAPGTDTNPAYYDRFTLPSVLQAEAADRLDGLTYVLGYPNAGTPIAEAFVRLARIHLGVELVQLNQGKITHANGSRELGGITSDYREGEATLAIDDTSTGGDTKIEGWQKIIEHNLAYAGLALIVERDPLGSALVREVTGAGVHPSIHWLTSVQRAADVLDLPSGAMQRELDYPVRLFEWNVANNNLGSLPRLDSAD